MLERSQTIKRGAGNRQDWWDDPPWAYRVIERRHEAVNLWVLASLRAYPSWPWTRWKTKCRCCEFCTARSGGRRS